jgi:hypothetical protein
MLSIYESAQQVVVYLGEPNGDSNKAISTLENQASRLRTVGFSFEWGEAGALPSNSSRGSRFSPLTNLGLVASRPISMPTLVLTYMDHTRGGRCTRSVNDLWQSDAAMGRLLGCHTLTYSARYSTHTPPIRAKPFSFYPSMRPRPRRLEVCEARGGFRLPRSRKHAS